MAGTPSGGKKAAATNKFRHGSDFYAEIGRMACFASAKIGADGLTGFERARVAGAKGGSISRRGPAKAKA